MKKCVIFTIFFGALVIFFAVGNSTFETVNIEIAENNFSVFAARTEKEHAQGLMGVESLDERAAGMLFIFPEAQERTFWNKHIRIPLGVIWINNGLVIGTSTLPDFPSNDIVTVTSPGPVDRVLEVALTNELFFELEIGQEIIF